jgi:hypothetical protein
MLWLRQWLRQHVRQVNRRSPRLAARPLVTELETRLVPAVMAHVTLHGGPVLDHVQVEVVFYGQGWTSPEGQGLQPQVSNHMKYLVDSTYMDIMKQYGVSHGTVTDSVVVPDNVGATVTSDQLVSALTQRQGDGTLKPANPNRLYFVFTPPGLSVVEAVNKAPDFLGYHSVFFDAQNNQNAFAIIPYPRAPNPTDPQLTEFQSLTQTSSHELAEALTDPYVDGQGNQSGWVDLTFNPKQPQQGEVGDICDSMPTVYLNNYAVEDVWSNQDNACMPPVGFTAAPTNGQLTVTARDVNAAANQAFTGAVALVTDTNPNAAGNLTATINWGDGTAPDTKVALTGPDANGNFTVPGTHTYATQGQQAILVTVLDSNNGAQASSTSTATVAPPGAGNQAGLKVTAQNITAQAGQAFTGTVALATDPGAAAGNLGATIDWGDGSAPSTVALTGPDAQGRFTVAGSHTYAANGSFKITATVTDANTGARTSDAATATVAAARTLAVTAQHVTATAGTAFTATVAVVSDPGAAAADLVATIDWGDGSPVDLNVALTGPDANGNFIASGIHNYAATGQFITRVTVTDRVSTRQLAGTSTADVAVAAGTNLIVTGQALAPAAGQPFTSVVALVKEPGATAGNLTATIDWGDGSNPDTNVPLTGPDANGNFTLNGTHTYAAAGQYGVYVTVDDAGNGAEQLAFVRADVQPAAGQGVLIAGRNLTATVGQPLAATVAVVDFQNAAAVPPNLTATINWGDGRQDTNVLLTPTAIPGRFVVNGSHTFLEAATEPVAITINGNNGVIVSGLSTVVVTNPPPAPQPPPAQLPAPQPPASGDVTAMLAITRVKQTRKGRRVRQTWVLKNTGGRPIAGPLFFVADGLGTRKRLKARLVGADGRTGGPAPSPFLKVVVPGGVLAPGQSVSVPVTLRLVPGGGPRFLVRVLGGSA